LRLLLDTHALLWWLTDHARLSTRASAAIRDGDNEVRMSAVSSWELALKISAGKLPGVPDLRSKIEQAIAKDRIVPLDITTAHGFAVEGLPWHHKDPFDRLLVAQARCERCLLVSNDRMLRAYPVELLW
jgi:PIN domain nuclease of toxin-antitoxin system